MYTSPVQLPQQLFTVTVRHCRQLAVVAGLEELDAVVTDHLRLALRLKRLQRAHQNRRLQAVEIYNSRDKIHTARSHSLDISISIS